MRLPSVLTTVALAFAGVAVPWHAAPANAATPAQETRQVLVSNQQGGCRTQQVIIADAFDGRLIKDLGKPAFMDGALSDAKPIDMNRKVLAVWGGHDDGTNDGISNRPGGIAIYDRTAAAGAGAWTRAYKLPNSFKTGEGNAHSVTQLSTDLFAVALVGPLNGGAQWGHVVVVKAPTANDQPVTVVSSVELDGAHGVEYDTSRNEVFAIGDDVVTRYTFDGTKLSPTKTYTLPASSTGGTPLGHDIRKRRDAEGDYYVTTNSNVYELSVATGTFTLVKKTNGSGIGGGVKSIDDRFDGKFAYSQSKAAFNHGDGTSVGPTSDWSNCMASYKHSRWIWAAGDPVYPTDSSDGNQAQQPNDRTFVWGDDVLTATTTTTTTGTDDEHLWVGGAAWKEMGPVRAEIADRVGKGKVPYIFFYHWGDSGTPKMTEFYKATPTDIDKWVTWAGEIAQGIGTGKAYVVVEPEWDLNLTGGCSNVYHDGLKRVAEKFATHAPNAQLINGMGFWSMSADWGLNEAYECFARSAGFFDLHGFTTHVVSDASHCIKLSNGGTYGDGLTYSESLNFVTNLRAKAGYLKTLFQADEVILYDVGITSCGWGTSHQAALFDLLGDQLPSLYDDIGLRGAYIRNKGPSEAESAMGIGNERDFMYKLNTTSNTRVGEAKTLIQNHLKKFGTTTPTPTFSSAASAQPTASPGETVSISATVTNTTMGLSNGVVTVEVWNGTTQVAKSTSTGQSFTAGQSKSYPYDFTVPATGSGTYVVKIGVFASNGTTGYHWNDNADSFTVASGTVKPTFTSSAGPATATAGTTMAIPVSIANSGGALTGGNVVVQVHDANDVKVGHIPLTNVNLPTGTTNLTASWLANQPAGTYGIKVGVFGPDWTPSYHWNAAAGTVTVTGTAATSFTSSATASRGSVVPGGSTTITATVTNTGSATLSGGNVLLEAYDAAGVERGEQPFPNVSIAPGASATFSWPWTVPSSTGTYTIKLGVFDSTWNTVHHWNERVATIGVTAIDIDSTAVVSPAVVAPSGSTTVSMSVTNNGGTLENGIVQGELWDPAGVKIDTESWSAQTFQGGETKTFSWPVTLPAGTGKYTVRIGVFGAGWAPTHDYNGSAGSLTVMAPAFTSSADVSSSSVSPGTVVTIDAKVTNTGGALVNGITQLEIYNSAGTRVVRHDWGQKTIRNGETATYTYPWTTPSTTGTYTVKLGVFGSTWSPTYHWNNGAATVSVGGSFQPSFRVGDGANTWWIEVYTSSDVTGVDVIGDDGRFYQSLAKKSWGAWAATPPRELLSGQLVRFVARRSSDGASAGSSNFGWLTQTPTTDPGWASTFTIGSGASTSWVEVYTSSSATAVEVKVGSGAFTALTKQSYGAWAKAMTVPAGSKVVFRATRSDGARSYSTFYNWLQ